MILVTSDLHFNNDPIDDYRWGLFDRLKEQIRRYNVEYLLMLGDYSVAKDRHPSSLVNKLVERITEISKLVGKLVMITGNHDYLEETNPFFSFLSKYQSIEFLISPKKIRLGEFECWFLPNTKTPTETWKALNFSTADFIFTHMTFKGARVENGAIMDGVSPEIFGNTKAKIVSGDIHVPQQLGRITYVGAPYAIHFADEFLPRVLLIDKEKEFHDLHFPCLKRHTLTISDDSDLKQLTHLEKEDQCKIRIPTSVVDVKALKLKIDKLAKEYGFKICKTETISDPKPKLEQIKQSLTSAKPLDLFKEYVKSDKIDEGLAETGEALLSKTLAESNNVETIS